MDNGGGGVFRTLRLDEERGFTERRRRNCSRGSAATRRVPLPRPSPRKLPRGAESLSRCVRQSAAVISEQPPRQGTSHRPYSNATIARLRFVRGAQNLGFSLKEIEDLMSLRVAPGASKADVKARAEAKIEEIREKMEDLQRMRDSLLKLIGACDGSGALDDCPILEAFDEGPS